MSPLRRFHILIFSTAVGFSMLIILEGLTRATGREPFLKNDLWIIALIIFTLLWIGTLITSAAVLLARLIRDCTAYVSSQVTASDTASILQRNGLLPSPTKRADDVQVESPEEMDTQLHNWHDEYRRRRSEGAG